jgi:Cd2+/Zn2+-exporting ATPase
MLIKGASTMETLSSANVIFFDKTGTLTKGNFIIEGLKNFSSLTAQEIKNNIYNLETYSSHPIATALCSNLKKEAKSKIFVDVIEHKGLGIEAIDELGNRYFLGSNALMKSNKIEIQDNNFDIYLCINNKLAAAFNIADEIKEDAKILIEKLKALKFEIIITS